MSGGLLGSQERAGGPSGWPGGLEALSTGVGGVRSPTLGPGEVARPSWRAGRGQEALLECWEGLRGPGKVRSFSRRAGSGWEAHQKGTGEVGRPSQRVGMGQEALEEGWDRSGCLSGDLGGVGMARRG